MKTWRKKPTTAKSFQKKINYIKTQFGLGNFYFDDFRQVAYIRDNNQPSLKLSQTPFQYDFRNGDFDKTWKEFVQAVADIASEHGFDIY